MPRTPTPNRSGRALRILEGIVLVVAAIYFGRPILMPLAMAGLLTLLLAPVVHWFERRRFPRPAAVSVVMAGIVALIVALVWIVGVQLVDLANHLPEYKEQVTQKLVALQPGEGENLWTKLRDFGGAVTEEISPEKKAKGKNGNSPPEDSDETSSPARLKASIENGNPSAAEVIAEQSDDDAPQPVEVQVVEELTPWAIFVATMTNASAPLAQAAIIFVLVVFMLVSREDMRNRIIRLAGDQKVILTTRTFEEMGRRISRYLLMNAFVNGGFGLVIGIGLQLIGVHYAPVWGFLAATLRFVPYAGPIISSVLPLGMAFVQDAGWTPFFLTIGLFAVCELITNNVIEPLMYGRSAGVTTVALLVAAAFWTWVWGPVGLMLSVPMTVVLAVLGKYIPELAPIGILLGDEPPLDKHIVLYQRLLAGDAEEAASLVETHASAMTPQALFDDVIVPALVMSERDRMSGAVTDADDQFVTATMSELLEDAPSPFAARPPAPASGEAPARSVYVVGIAAEDESDRLALTMLFRLLNPAHYETSIVGGRTLVSEILENFADRTPDVVCISALGPGGVGKTRYLTKRIRAQFPDLRIVVGRWSYGGDRDKMAAGHRARGATQVVCRLDEAVETLQRIRAATPGES